MCKTIVITGANSGIGLATAKLFAKKGWTVYDFSRRDIQTEGIKHIYADVTDEESLKKAFETVYNNEKRLDALVNNAGFGISGPIELTKTEDAQRQLDVNFFGVVRTVKEALPYLRQNGGGRIINVSSMGAPLSLPFQAFYSCSKAAVNAYTLALCNELRPFCIKVCAVMPGDVKTGFTNAREKNAGNKELYGDTVEKSVSQMEKDEQNGMNPERIARCIYKRAVQKNPKPLCTVGFLYKLIAFLIKILPESFVNFAVGKIYS